MILSIMLTLAGVGRTLAQSSYALVAWTVDDGGDTITGGPYNLSTTIGQHDAGLLQGGSYVLYGGFWGGEVSGPMPRQTDVTIFLPLINTYDSK
jgi:hypothetical protein